MVTKNELIEKYKELKESLEREIEKIGVKQNPVTRRTKMKIYTKFLKDLESLEETTPTQRKIDVWSLE